MAFASVPTPRSSPSDPAEITTVSPIDAVVVGSKKLGRSYWALRSTRPRPTALRTRRPSLCGERTQVVQPVREDASASTP